MLILWIRLTQLDIQPLQPSAVQQQTVHGQQTQTLLPIHPSELTHVLSLHSINGMLSLRDLSPMIHT